MSYQQIRLKREEAPGGILPHDYAHEDSMRQYAQESGKELFQIAQQLASGQPPTTESLASALDRAERVLHNEEINNPILQQNEKARQTIKDTGELLAASRTLLLNKTADNKFQRFIMDSILAAREFSSMGHVIYQSFAFLHFTNIFTCNPLQQRISAGNSRR